MVFTEDLNFSGQYYDIKRIEFALLAAGSVQEKIQGADPADKKWRRNVQHLSPPPNDTVSKPAKCKLSVSGALHFKSATFEQLQKIGARVSFALVAELVCVDFSRRHGDREN